MNTALIIVHVLLAIGLVGLVLVQQGKGADMGTAFGAGASGTLFGASGAGNFLTRTTAILATLFFLTSLGLAYFAMQTGQSTSLMDTAGNTPVQTPAAVSSEIPDIAVDVPPQSDVPEVKE
jgi:preprotein translocase subunit SecG